MRENKKKYIMCGSVFAVILLGLVLFYTYKIEPKIGNYNMFRKISVENGEYLPIEKLKEKTNIRQIVKGERETLEGFDLTFRKTSATPKDTIVNIKLLEENGTLIQEWSINMNGIADFQIQRFLLEKPLKNTWEKTYIIDISSLDLSVAGVALSSTNQYEEGKMYIDGKVVGQTVVFNLLNNIHFIKKLFWIICIILVVGFLGLCVLQIKGVKQVENYFLILGATFGIIFIILLPPGIAPDDHSHIATTYRDANILTGQNTVNDAEYVMVRKSDAELENTHKLNINTLSYYNSLMRQKKETDNTRVNFDRWALNVSIFAHLPQAIGVTIGWLLNLNGIVTLYLGKIAALVFYLVVVYFSIKFLPWGKMILISISLFPMSLQMVTSFNYDLVVNALSFFIISYTMYLIYDKEKVGWKDYLLLGIAGVTMVPCKVVYLFICGIIFFIPDSKTKNKKVSVSWKCGIIVAVFICLLIQKISQVQSMLISSGGVNYTLNQILIDLHSSIGVIFETCFTQISYYLGGIVGQSLGWFQINISWYVIIGFIVLCVFSFVEDGKDSREMSVQMKIASWIFCVIMAGGILLSMWLDATPSNHPHIAGVQGRYFLPFLPLLMLAVKPRNITSKNSICEKIFTGTFIFQMITVLEILVVALQA